MLTTSLSVWVSDRAAKLACSPSNPPKRLHAWATAAAIESSLAPSINAAIAEPPAAIDLLGQRLTAIQVVVAQDEMRAFLRKAQRDCFADAPAAGHQNHLALKPIQIVPPIILQSHRGLGSRSRQTLHD
jgi:hypothetical protein